jgi:iron-sulfur cluster assembly protein
MAISVTSAAAEHVSKQLQARGRGEGIRIGVKTSGCSGLAYVLEFVDVQDPEDTLFETDGVRVFVDPKSLVYLDGTIVDFAKEGLNEGLEFRNPNVETFVRSRDQLFSVL